MANKIVWVTKARLAFAENVFTKSGIAGDPTSKPRFGCGLLISPKDKQVAALQAAQEELVLGHDWKGDAGAAAVLKLLQKKDRLALHDGDDKPNLGGYPGNLYLSPSADVRPTVVGRDRAPILAEDGVVYSGCYVNAKVELWVQDNKWGQRVNATLLGIQFVEDGDAFGSGSAPADPDDFPDLDASGEDEDDGLFD